MNDLKDIKRKRKELEKQLQDDYNSKSGYIEKFKYIYNLLIKSQRHYLKYTSNKIFNEIYFNELINKLKATENLTDDIFVDFIKENLMSKIKCGHIYLIPHAVDGKNTEEFLSKINDGQNVEYKFSGDTLILKIKSFHKSNYKRDKAVFDELREILHDKQVDNIIFDLRGNGGGADQYIGYFQIFFSKDFKNARKSRNLLTDENEIRDSIFSGFSDSKEYNRYVLIDEKCFSTTDSFVRFCKTSGFATLIGQPTRGEGFGMNPFKIQITKSEYNGKYLSGYLPAIIKGIEINYPIDAPINDLGEIDYENFYRTAPDIVCDASDALNVAFKEIEKKKCENKDITKSI
ncbi:MAG: S41 family peptidase [Clostridia bacterium]|nr:S41 family peptidase [Clostridia bacterium]